MQYYGTKDNLNYGFFKENFESAIPITDSQMLDLINQQSIGRKIVSDNISVFSTDTPEKYYINELGLWETRTDEEINKQKEEQEKNIKINDLKKEISDLDAKRIRAICEPAIKNNETGETWLDFYNSQIIYLRNQLTELTGETNDFE